MDRLQAADQVSTDQDRSAELASACPEPRRRLLSTRFTYEDVASMVAKFDSGTPARIVAEEYQIGITSLKRLIRERGARRKDR
jgi:hypothetical protein